MRSLLGDACRDNKKTIFTHLAAQLPCPVSASPLSVRFVIPAEIFWVGGDLLPCRFSRVVLREDEAADPEFGGADDRKGFGRIVCDGGNFLDVPDIHMRCR